MSRGRPRTSHRLLVEYCTYIFPPKRGMWRPNPLAPNHGDITYTWQDGLQLTVLVELTATVMPTGGRRFWLICPGCKRRCGRLYQVDGSQCFHCRVCLELAYRVQYRKSASAMRVRLLRRLLDDKWWKRQLRKALG
jgi:hypothetical protein